MKKLTKPTCYLCEKELVGNTTEDHIIPDGLFEKNDPYRPKLVVHETCNSSKSLDDEWFIKKLQIRSSNNPEVMAKLRKFMDQAIQEKNQAYIIGAKIPKYKLARSLFDDVTWGLLLKSGGKDLIQLKIHTDETRFYRYIKNVCRGLFIFNIANSKPPIPEVFPMQYEYLNAKNRLRDKMENIHRLIKSNRSGNFGQQWANRILYIGSRVTETQNKGYIFMEFYSQFGILAFFK